MNFEEKGASVGGCEIQYRVAGDGEPVVMLHGAGGFRHDERAFEGIAEHFRLLVPSMPGFDRSSAGATANFLDVADLMAEFIRRVTGGEAAVIGESFGGAVSSFENGAKISPRELTPSGIDASPLRCFDPEVEEARRVLSTAGERDTDGVQDADLCPMDRLGRQIVPAQRGDARAEKAGKAAQLSL